MATKTQRKCAYPGCDQPGSKTCGGCRLVGYCSKEHQRDDWPNHKQSCKKPDSSTGSQAGTGDSSAPVVQMPKRPMEDVSVTWDDQKRINTFGRLNQKHVDLLESIRVKKVKRENLVDALDALDEPDSDDEDAIKLQIGEVFIASKKGSAQERVQQEITKLDAELKEIRGQKTEISKEMASLKALLKAKFKDSINLDYEVEDPDEETDSTTASSSTSNSSSKPASKPSAAPAKSAAAQTKPAGKKPAKKKDSDDDDDDLD